jgi:hypothetical protein
LSSSQSLKSSKKSLVIKRELKNGRKDKERIRKDQESVD